MGTKNIRTDVSPIHSRASSSKGVKLAHKFTAFASPVKRSSSSPRISTRKGKVKLSYKNSPSYTFQFSSPEKSFLISATTAREKKQWLDGISVCIEESKKKNENSDEDHGEIAP